MREALKNAVQSAILFECQLPHQESGLGKSCLSSQNDICFNNTDPQEIAKVIYNGIVEFALNEYEINYDDLERDGNIDLWFGEAKFYLRYKDAITPVMEKLGTSLSDGYLNRNLIAIINERDHLSVHNTQLNSLLDSWFENPSINLAQEMQNRGIRLIYPIFIAYEKANRDAYHQSIKKCIDHIAAEYARIGISIPATFDYRLFFIFLPLSEVKQIKESVIQWIDSQEPLI